MIELPFYRNFYEQTGLRKEDISLEERVPITLGMIPLKIKSCLDLGCGDGTILNKLNRKLFKVGLDISHNALLNARVERKVLACSSMLPFRPNSYDLVICTEVLEHLPSEKFKLSINEIQRIAKKNILVSVPFQEQLDRKEACCPNCGFIFHIHMHLRSFNLTKLKTMFTNFFPKFHQFSHTSEKSYPAWLLKIRRNYGHRWEWEENALCPRCGHKNNHPPQRTPISVMTSALANIFAKNRPKWIAVIYEKK
jgi:ubiquinone/menaquinone biosynthesis C-methylase UbiE